MNRDKGKRASRGVPARRVRRTVRRVRRAPARDARALPTGGLGERSEGSRSARGAGGSPGRPFRPRTRTASSEGARRSDSPRAARVTPCATCAARPRVVRTPPGARRSEGEARAKRRNGTAEAEPRDQPAREIRTASSEGARRSDSLRAVRVASRVACAARPLVMRAPPPACGWIEGGPRAERWNKRREEEKSTTHAQNTDRELRGRSALGLPTRRARRGARVACAARPLVMRAPPRRHAGGSRERRARSDGTREEERRREHHTRDVRARLRRREPPVTHARRVHRARIAGRDAGWRGPVPHEATTKEKARDKDDDRRQRTGEDQHSYEPKAGPLRT